MSWADPLSLAVGLLALSRLPIWHRDDDYIADFFRADNRCVAEVIGQPLRLDEEWPERIDSRRPKSSCWQVCGQASYDRAEIKAAVREVLLEMLGELKSVPVLPDESRRRPR